MVSASYPYSSYRQPQPLWRRIIAILLALIVNLLVVLVLLGIANLPALKPKPERKPILVQLEPGGGATTSRTKTAAKHAGKATPKTAPPRAPVTPLPAPTSRPASEAEMPPGFIHLSHDEFARSDIGRMPREKSAPSDAAAANVDNVGDSRVVGIGPDGSNLYEGGGWYRGRQPSQAQTDPYLKKDRLPVGSVALIMCRTAPRYHLEDCRPIGDNVPGSGYARGIANAAWQFLFEPPRVNGKPLIGVWIRIKYTTVESMDGEEK